LWEFKQLLPFVLWEKWLLLLCAKGVLSLPLLLPCLDLRLFASERTLVVLSVVLLGLVVLDALKEEIAGLFEEWVDGEVQAVEVGREWVGGNVWVVRELGER
jgi:hypothetical protein